MFREVTIRYR